jgi:hypothetical protein
LCNARLYNRGEIAQTPPKMILHASSSEQWHEAEASTSVVCGESDSLILFLSSPAYAKRSLRQSRTASASD